MTKKQQAKAALTEGRILEALSYKYPYFICSICLEQQEIKDWPTVCPRCGTALRLVNETENQWSLEVTEVSDALRVRISTRIAEARRTAREFEHDPRALALEAELEAATVALGIKGGRGWQQRLDREHMAMYGPDLWDNANDLVAAYWRHLPHPLQIRLQCMDKLSWLVDQWYERGLSGEPQNFDADLAEMRRLLKLVNANPYDVSAKATLWRRDHRAGSRSAGQGAHRGANTTGGSRHA
jgi:hypothetical protein